MKSKFFNTLKFLHIFLYTQDNLGTAIANNASSASSSQVLELPIGQSSVRAASEELSRDQVNSNFKESASTAVGISSTGTVHFGALTASDTLLLYNSFVAPPNITSVLVNQLSVKVDGSPIVPDGESYKIPGGAVPAPLPTNSFLSTIKFGPLKSDTKGVVATQPPSAPKGKPPKPSDTCVFIYHMKTSGGYKLSYATPTILDYAACSDAYLSCCLLLPDADKQFCAAIPDCNTFVDGAIFCKSSAERRAHPDPETFKDGMNPFSPHGIIDFNLESENSKNLSSMNMEGVGDTRPGFSFMYSVASSFVQGDDEEDPEKQWPLNGLLGYAGDAGCNATYTSRIALFGFTQAQK